MAKYLLHEQSNRKEHGFTLIEVMLATVIGSLVIGAVAVISVESLRAQQTARLTIRNRWTQQRIWRQFEHDLESEITWLPSDKQTISLTPEPGRLFEVISLADVLATETMFRTQMPAKVAYFVTAEEGDSPTKTLWRETLDLTNVRMKPVRQTLAAGLSNVRLEAHDTKGWEVPRVGRTDRPDALRLVCQWAEDPRGEQTRTVELRYRVRTKGNRP